MEFDGSVLICSSSDLEPVEAVEARRCPLTLHCQRCSTVLGDSTGICGDTHGLDAIICLKVTDDVIVCDPVESLQGEGKMANCIYSPLKCGCCCSPVGKVIHSSPPCLNTLRSLFLLNKANISCYILRSSSMVKASAFEFNQKTVGEDMDKVKQQFEEHLEHMMCIKSRLGCRSRTHQSKK